MGKNAKSTKHRKTRDFLAGPGGRRLGRRPLSPTERREPPSAMPRPGGPWPDRAAAPAADPGKDIFYRFEFSFVNGFSLTVMELSERMHVHSGACHVKWRGSWSGSCFRFWVNLQ